MLDLSFQQQLVQGLQPVERLHPVGHPAVQLEQVDPLDAQPAQGLFHRVPQMPPRIPAAHLGSIVIGVRPDRGLHLGGHVDPVAAPLA